MPEEKRCYSVVEGLRFGSWADIGFSDCRANIADCRLPIADLRYSSYLAETTNWKSAIGSRQCF
jgi:hypothetical protein